MPDDMRPLLPDQATPSDYLHAVVKGGLSAIPYVGGTASELFALVLAPPLAERRDIWLQQLAEDFDALQRKINGFTVESLAANPEFVSATLKASQAALKTHRREKLDALRNAVVNVAAGKAPNEDKQAIFLNLVDQFTPLHLRFLQFQQQAGKHLTAYLKAHPGMLSPHGGPPIFAVVQSHFPELTAEPRRIHSIFRDLHATGLSGVEGAMQAPPKWERWTTHLGDEFLRFITAPELDKEP